jgi:hypothetical protein
MTTDDKGLSLKEVILGGLMLVVGGVVAMITADKRPVTKEPANPVSVCYQKKTLDDQLSCVCAQKEKLEDRLDCFENQRLSQLARGGATIGIETAIDTVKKVIAERDQQEKKLSILEGCLSKKVLEDQLSCLEYGAKRYAGYSVEDIDKEIAPKKQDQYKIISVTPVDDLDKRIAKEEARRHLPSGPVPHEPTEAEVAIESVKQKIAARDKQRLQARCNEIRNKKMADLTVADREMFGECGISPSMGR